MIPIIMSNIHDDRVFYVDSLKEAGMKAGITSSCVSQLLKSGRSTKDGWTFDIADGCAAAREGKTDGLHVSCS